MSYRDSYSNLVKLATILQKQAGAFDTVNETINNFLAASKTTPAAKIMPAEPWNVPYSFPQAKAYAEAMKKMKYGLGATGVAGLLGTLGAYALGKRRAVAPAGINPYLAAALGLGGGAALGYALGND